MWYSYIVCTQDMYQICASSVALILASDIWSLTKWTTIVITQIWKTLNVVSWCMTPVFSCMILTLWTPELRIFLQFLFCFLSIISSTKLLTQHESHPDSSTNVCIEDCYIRNGDDIVVIKSGWDEYGISFAHPSSNISIRNITGQTRNSAGIAFGSEMSGGISNVRAEGIHIVNSVHGIRIKTAPGRGGYVKNVYVADVSLDNVSIAIRITGNYGEHPDENYNRNALPTISNITIKNIVGVNIGVAGMLQGISGDNFSNICLSNVSLSVRSTNPWNCSLVEGYSNSVSPEICEQLRTGSGPGQVCYDGNSYPAAAAQPQSPQKSSACRLVNPFFCIRWFLCR